jgi:hypothetical protein
MCSFHGEKIFVYRSLVVLKMRWEDNSKLVLKEIECKNEREMGKSGSESCAVAGFGTISVEPLGSSTTRE